MYKTYSFQQKLFTYDHHVSPEKRFLFIKVYTFEITRNKKSIHLGSLDDLA